jgi:hypothetical protein
MGSTRITRAEENVGRSEPEDVRGIDAHLCVHRGVRIVRLHVKGRDMGTGDQVISLEGCARGFSRRAQVI